MGISLEDWRERIAIRSDLTGRLTHLTRPHSNVDTAGMTFEQINYQAVDNLIKILREQKLQGSLSQSGYIVGDRKAVCFQDTPLYALIQNVNHERQRREKNQKEKLRYCGVGLSFVKPHLYHYYNARSVVYGKKDEFKAILPQNEWWRIVNLDYKMVADKWDIIDWTHEREWRVPDELNFDFEKVHVHIILYNPSCVTRFLSKCPSEILSKVHGISTLTSLLM